MPQGRQPAAMPHHTRRLVASGCIVFLALFAYVSYLFQRYDWDTVETVLLPAARGLPFEPVPYSFLMYGMASVLSLVADAQLLFGLLLLAACAAYLASGLLVYAIARHAGCSALAAFAAAGVCLSANAMTYGASHMDDNVFQTAFMVLSLWLLIGPGRVILSAVAFGIAAAFHIQVIPMAAALLVLLWGRHADGPAEAVRRAMIWGPVGAAVFLLLLVVHVDPRTLFGIVATALSEGRDAFAIVKEAAPPWLATLWGMVASLLPLPVNAVPLLQHHSLGPVLLIAGLALIAAILLPVLAATLQARRDDRPLLFYRLHLFVGLAACTGFAYFLEPEIQERWIQGAPFFGLLVGEWLRVFETGRWRAVAQRLRPAVGPLVLLMVIGACLIGRPLAHIAYADSRTAITAGLIQELAAAFDGETALLLDDGLEMVAFHREADSCYRIVEYHALQIKCWGPEGRRYLPVDRPDFLAGRDAFAIYRDFPELPALGLPETTPREVCDRSWAGRLFGHAACVTLRTGSR